MKCGIRVSITTLSYVHGSFYFFGSRAILIFNGEINDTQLFSNQNLKEF